MSAYDQRTLLALGVGLTHREVPVPLYVQRRVVPHPTGHQLLVQLRPPTTHYLASLIFQIVDVAKFLRFVK